MSQWTPMGGGQLEQRLWYSLRNLGADRHPRAAREIADMLDAADLYARHQISELTTAAGSTPGQRRQAVFAARSDIGHARIDRETA